MPTKEKAKQAVRLVRQEALKAMEDTHYASKHNNPFDELHSRELEKKLNNIACRLEDILETGFVSPH